MESLCGHDPIFNETLLLDSPWPHFTECFQSSLLIWVPCGWLWVTLPFYLLYLFKYHRGIKIPINKLNIVRTVLSVLLAVFTILHILKGVSDSVSDSKRNTPEHNVHKIIFLSGSIQACTFLLSAVLIQIERIKGVITSGILWIFWLMSVIAGIVPIYSKLYLEEYRNHMFPFALFYISYICLCAQFILSFFAEKLIFNGYYNLTTGHCPEMQASFPSRLIFSWMYRFIFFVYRGGLQEDDLFSLHPRDQGSNVIPEFQTVWNRELNNARNRTSTEQYTPTSSYASFQRVASKTSLYTESTPLLIPRALSVEVVNERRVKRANASLFKVLVKVYGFEMLLSHVLMLAFDLLQFVSPLLLGALITFTRERKEINKEHHEWKGYILALSFLLVNVFSSTLLHQCYHIGMTLGMRVKSALMATLFKKILTISSYARKGYTDKQLMDLVSVDCHRMQDVVGYLWMVWSAPLEITIAMYMLWHVVGASTLAGLGVLILLMPVNAIIATMSQRYQRVQIKLSEKRVHLMNEIVGGMKILKMHSWEDHYLQKVEDLRSQELAILKKISYFNVFSTVCWTCAPYLVPLATFTAYVLTHNQLDAYTAFVALALFNILRFPINLLPMMATLILHHLLLLSSVASSFIFSIDEHKAGKFGSGRKDKQATTSIRRLGALLSEEDMDDSVVNYNHELTNAIQIDKATFSWENTLHEAPTLMNISLEIPEGQLVAIVGQSGSGKSSLVSAILGQIEKTKGYVSVKSSIAYVPQQAWIQNVSAQENILFFKSMDSHLYSKVIDVCALKEDMDSLPDRDRTELGERGIDVTLDQKQRLNLARAVYQEADIYLLDDVLNGVDSSVARHVFDKVISNRGMLKQKTRLLVTHDIHWLPQVDTIVVLVDGRISEMGSYDQLLAQEGDFARFLKNTLREDGDELLGMSDREDPEISAIRAQMLQRVDTVTPDMSSGDESWKTRSGEESFLRKSRSELTASGITLDDLRDREKRQKERLLEEERVEIRKVKLSVLLTYFRSVGVVATGLFFAFFAAYQSINAFSGVLLAQWTRHHLLGNGSLANTSGNEDRNHKYLGVYGALGLIQVFLVLIYALIASTGMVKAAGVLHRSMLNSIMHSPMAFFDITPLGRILNRFSRDVDKVDNTLPQQLRSWMNTFLSTVCSLIIIGYCTPIFLVVIVPLTLLYFLIQRLYIPVSREMKKMESTTRGPIHTHFNEIIHGVSSIQAYQAEDKYITDSRHLVDTNLICCFTDMSLNRWLAIGVEAVGNLVVFFTAFLSVVSENMDEALVGLSVCLSLQVTSGLSWMVRGLTELESNIISMERINHYTRIIHEGPDSAYMKEPLQPWPQTGSIRFHHVTSREKPSFDLILNNISCEIHDKEKIGIIGTPGTDNFHLVQVLFRLVEVASGTIIIDNVMISDISLHDLRTGINILSVQDPVVFTGTLRMNLDPCNIYTDEEIWKALNVAHLKDFILDSSEGLLFQINDMGENLSFSHRQLICLARALLHKTKILVFDETPIDPSLPVAAVSDFDTEDLIQNTVREQFKDCTVLAVTSRINTIMDYDRVMVMAHGTMREIGSPSYLLQDENSVFYSLAKDANLV